MRISDWSSDVCSSDLGLVDQLQSRERIVERIGGKRHRQARGDLVVDLAAEREGLVALLVAQVAADRRARLAGDREVEPIALRRLRVRAQNLQDRKSTRLNSSH